MTTRHRLPESFRFDRRHFLKSSAATAGVLTLGPWVLDLEAAQAAALDKPRLADAALATARSLGATYADIRINRYRRESIYTREAQVEELSRSQSFGFGVRVLSRGAWGFAASRNVTAEEIRRVTRQAIEIAHANAAFRRSAVTLAPAKGIVASWKSTFRLDPFDIPVEDKIDFLLNLNETARKVQGINFVNSMLEFVNEQKFFASSDGSRIEQYIIRSFPSFDVTAVDSAKGDAQTRYSHRGAQGVGYEYVRDFPWLAEAEQAGNEAVAKLQAKPVEPGRYDLVLHPTNLALTIHETTGHSTELDRALGWEAAYAGTSFLTPDKAGTLRFGSNLVNMVADRTQPAALATVGYDDDGVPAQRWHLVKDGVFVDWQTTRELAASIGRESSYGCSYADSWGTVAFARMPNVSLEPAEENITLDDLVAGVENGILIYGVAGVSIDQQRYNFQATAETAWEIKDGKRGAMLRDVSYQARTPDFWAACDGLGGATTYELHGFFGDGKGQPVQSNAVSHGCPVARFRQINVLNGRG